MSAEWRVCVSSPPDRTKLVAEIFFGDQQWAELNQEGPELQLQLYGRNDGKPWEIPYSEVIAALEEAKKRLVYGARRGYSE